MKLVIIITVIPKLFSKHWYDHENLYLTLSLSHFLTWAAQVSLHLYMVSIQSLTSLTALPFFGEMTDFQKWNSLCLHKKKKPDDAGLELGATSIGKLDRNLHQWFTSLGKLGKNLHQWFNLMKQPAPTLES